MTQTSWKTKYSVYIYPVWINLQAKLNSVITVNLNINIKLQSQAVIWSSFQNEIFVFHLSFRPSLGLFCLQCSLCTAKNNTCKNVAINLNISVCFCMRSPSRGSHVFSYSTKMKLKTKNISLKEMLSIRGCKLWPLVPKNILSWTMWIILIYSLLIPIFDFVRCFHREYSTMQCWTIESTALIVICSFHTDRLNWKSNLQKHYALSWLHFPRSHTGGFEMECYYSKDIQDTTFHLFHIFFINKEIPAQKWHTRLDIILKKCFHRIVLCTREWQVYCKMTRSDTLFTDTVLSDPHQDCLVLSCVKEMILSADILLSDYFQPANISICLKAPVSVRLCYRDTVSKWPCTSFKYFYTDISGYFSAKMSTDTQIFAIS